MSPVSNQPWILLVAAALTLSCASGQAPARDPMSLSLSDEAAIFTAAGFRLEGAEWRSCDLEHDGAYYGPGRIEEVGDLNGDDLPEVVVSEDSLLCYGMVATAYVLVSKQAGGGWSGMMGGRGIPEFLPSKGVDGWPDIAVGGPGFCFPVLRWNGTAYALNRHEYGGEPCAPPGAR